MPSNAPILNLLSHSRGRAFVLPREHGAWGMLLVPLATGAAAGHPQGERISWILIFAAAALGLFCLRTPLEAALGVSSLRPQNAEERKLIHLFISFYAFVAGGALVFLIERGHAYGLLVLGAAAAIAFLFQTILKQLGRQTRMNAQLTGAVALSSTAAGAYYLATGRFDELAAMLWLANWLFAADQIHFVQLRIHSARATTLGEKFRQGSGFLLHQGACLLFLAFLWRAGGLPGVVALAFAPLFIRGAAWFLASPQPLRVHQLGVSELLYAIVFGIFFIAGFHHSLG